MKKPTELPLNGVDQEKREGVLATTVPIPTKTPFYQATHASRYQRQAIIRTIQDGNGKQLICYVAGTQAPMSRDDTIGFVDLLHNVQPTQDLDILLHTVGGDVDTAEKLILLVRSRLSDATLRIIVPDYAKSAGTLMVLGADSVVMSDTSELGPIDPQIIRADSEGNITSHSVQHYLDSYEDYCQALKADPSNVAAQIMMQKLDPSRVKYYQGVRDRARKLAEKLLQQYMFKNGGNWSKTADTLMNTKRWQTHGQVISSQDARDPEIGLTVEHLDPHDPTWQAYWQLYCLQRLATTKTTEKLFESGYASLLIEG